jgi:hypothetical protein
MREVHERDTGDDADIGPGTRPDAAAGPVDDPRRPAIAILRDSATRAALALEYRQRVKRADAESGAVGTAPSDDRGDRAHRMPDEGNHIPGIPPGRNTGVRGDDHRGEDARSQDIARRPARGPTFP